MIAFSRAMRAIPLAFALAATLDAARAGAEDLRLSWRAPAGCPSGARVRDAALKNTGRAGVEPLEADVQVEHAERWKVTIRSTRNGIAADERTVEGASCEAVADAAAVILGVAMIPPEKNAAESSARQSAEARDEPSANPSTADARSRAAAEMAAATPSRRAHGFAANVGGATDGTTLPSAALGGRVGLAWTPGRTRLELTGSLFSAQSKTTASTQAGGRFTLFVAAARGCWALLQGAFELSPCAGIDLQSVSAKGFGASQNYDASGAWVSAAGGALVRVPLTSWLAVRADADALVPLSRPTFVVEGDGAVHRPSSIGARAGIGAELLFL